MTRDETLKEIAARIPGRPDARLRALWLACLLIGAASFAFLLLREPTRAWGAYGACLVYFLGLPLGAAALASAIRLANGRWGGPVTRIAESLTAFLPWGILLTVVLLAAGLGHYLPWTRGGVLERQRPYLNVPFLVARTLVGLGLLWWLVSDMVRTSLRRDVYLLREHVEARLRPAYERLARGWRGDEAEERRERDRLAMRSPQVALAFAVVFTVFAWDFIMSITPTWVSGLFGWWVFMGAFLSAIAMTALLATRLRSRHRLERWITTDHFWDTGKLLFGFSVFWVYLFWSQYLVIWYANLPEETWWVFLRFEEPWRRLAFTVFGLVFLLPFLGLMNKRTKTSPAWLAVFAILVLVGMWLERLLLVMPSLNPDQLWVGLPELGVALGFLGIFGLSVQHFLAKYPAIKVTDALAGVGPGH
jgi:hypothetical protein